MESSPIGFEKKYMAFISYSHSNNREEGRKWADWLHQALETYEVPEDLAGKKNTDGKDIPRQIFPVFQDEKELSASSSLNDSLKKALEKSEFLIYLSSPRSAQSQYVREELKYFKQIGKKKNIVALILSGEPEYGGVSSENQCFPDELRYNIDENGHVLYNQPEEVLAADVRIPHTMDEGFTSPEAYRRFLQSSGVAHSDIKQKADVYKEHLDLAKLKIISGILGVPLGELTKRDKAYQLEKVKRKNRNIKRVATALSILAVIAVVSGIFAWMQKNRAQQSLARSLYTSGINKLTESEFGDGAAYIAEATRSGDKNAALFGQSMLAVQEDLHPLPNILISNATFSPDGKWIAAFASVGAAKNVLQIWDATDRKLVKQRDDISATMPRQPLIDTQNRVYVCNSNYDIVRYNIKEGNKAIIRTNPSHTFTRLNSVSPNGKFIVCTGSNGKIEIADTETGLPVAVFISKDVTIVPEVVFSPNASLAVILASDSKGIGKAKILSLGNTGAIQEKEFNLLFSVPKVVFNNEGNEVIIFGGDRLLRYNTVTGSTWEKSYPQKFYKFIGFNNDAKTLAAGKEDGLDIIDINNGNVVKKTDLPRNIFAYGELPKLLENPTSFDVKNISPDRTQELVSLNKQTFIQNLKEMPLLTAQYWLGKDYKLLRPGLNDEEAFVLFKKRNTLGLLSLANGALNEKYITIPEEIALFDVLEKSGILALKSASDKAYFFDAKTGKPVGEIIATKPGRFFYDKGQKQLMARLSENSFAIWDIRTGKQNVNYTQAQPLGRFIISPDFDNILIADTASWRVIHVADRKMIKENKGRLSGAAYSPDGAYLSVIYQNGLAEVYDTKKYEQDFKVNSIENAFITFSNNGKVMALSQDTRHMRLWNLHDKKPFGQTIKVNQFSKFFHFTNDGTKIFVQDEGAMMSSQVKIVDAKTGNILTMPFAPGKYDHHVYILPGDKKVLTVESLMDGYSVNIWEIPGSLQINDEQLAGDLEKFYGKKYDAQTGAVNTSYHTKKDFSTWYFQDVYTRSLSPVSKVSVIEDIEKHMPVKSNEDLRVLIVSRFYHPLARAAVALYFSKMPETEFIARRIAAITQLQLIKIKDRKLKTQVEGILSKVDGNLKKR